MFWERKDRDYDMRFVEWIQKPGKKIIVTDRVANGMRLLRKCNREQGIDNKESSCKTLQQIAEELFLAHEAFLGRWEVPEMIGAETGSYILDDIIRRKEYSFVPKECYCIQTSEVIMQSINQIRMNETTQAYEQEETQKLVEIKDLTASYEACLQERKCMDYAALLKVTEQVLKEIDREELRLYLPWLFKCEIGVLEDLEWTSLEARIFKKLLELAGLEVTELTFYSYSKEHMEYHFFRAYGIVNEIGYVIKQITEKGIPYGQVNLFYTAPVYENFIKSAFDSAGIGYQFLTGEKIASSNTVRFMISILEWAKSDFLYERLHAVVENPLLTFGNIIEKENSDEGVIKNPATCYHRFLRKGIGWDRDRYLACIKRVENNSEESHKYQYFIRFLKELVSIFEDTTNCGVIYERVFRFTMRYTLSQSVERKRIRPVLEAQQAILSQVAMPESMEEAISLITERLQQLTVKDEQNQGQINVFRVQNLEVLERPYNFIIGLSAKQFVADTTESPVLSDEELKKYLTGKVFLASEAGVLLRENLKRTMETLEQGHVFMGYSTYDTIELKESSPSVFYLDYKDYFGKVEEIAYSTYEVCTDAIKITADVDRELTENLQEEAGAFVSMSSSGLQTLAKCPLSYYYHYVQMLPSIEYQEKKAHQWLSPADKGNLFHRVLERYCEEILMPADEVPENVDGVAFERMYEAAVTEMLEELPYAAETIFLQEKEREREVIWQYLWDFLEDLLKDAKEGKKWKVLGCELEFERLSYQVCNPGNQAAGVEVLFGGSIDRLDGYVSEQILHLRIVDYKTGDIQKKKGEIKAQQQLQHFIYAMAAQEYATTHRKELEALFDSEIQSIEICDVHYEFPNEKKEERILDATEIVLKERKDAEYRLPASIDEILWNVLGNLYCGEPEAAQTYMTQHAMEQEIAAGGKQKLEMCYYCKYLRQCRRKIGEEL